MPTKDEIKNAIIEAIDGLLPDEPAEQPEPEEQEEEPEPEQVLDLSYVKSLQIEPPDFTAVKFVAKDEIKGYSHL